MTATAASPPVDTGDARVELADLFLHGDGLEIGALHLPTVLPAGTHARYVDRMSVSDLRQHYPELAELELTPVDVIDDGERLETIPPESVDFIVANHFLEHCQDPIRTIETHLSKLRPDGTLFYAVPDKRYTFDFRRPRTPLQHVIDDHEQGPERSRAGHYLEWAQLVYGDEEPTEEQVRAAATQLEAEDYSIHFHVWTQADLAALMFHIHQRRGNFEVEAIRRHSIENIVVLRKHSEPTATVNPEPTSTPAPAPAPDADVSSRVPVALAGLRARLDHGSATAHWSIDPDGLAGRAWVLSTKAPVTVPLVLDGPAALRARAQLLPHDWRDATNGVDGSIVAVLADGQRAELWNATLTPADDPSGLAIDCLVPEDTRELRMTISKRGVLSERSIARMALIEPYLTDPRSDVVERPGARRTTPPRPVEGPLISVLCPVHDPPPYMLREAIESVREQTYGNWELVLCDDGSRDPEVIALLDRCAAEDPRVTVSRRPHAGGISIATNSALAAAAGEYVALLDHDDTLDPDALARVVELLDLDSSLDMVYTDEAVVADGELVARHLKPDWSPELMEIAMYTTHLGVYRRSLTVELGGFSPEFDGTQDYDFVLRLSDRTDRIGHIPELLYHWRAHADSTAGGEQAKPYAYAAQPAAIASHLRRRGIDADVQHGAAPGLHRIVHRVDPELGVTIVVTVEQADGLYEAARSWAAQPHSNWRVIVSVPADQLAAATDALHAAGIGSTRITALVSDPALGPMGALHAAARRAHTDHLLLMQTPLIGLSHDWLTRLVGYSDQAGIAAAGPVVLTDDGRIAHAGVAIPDGLPLPLVHGLEGAAAPSAAMNVTAVDCALVTALDTYREIGGLNPGAGSVALVDYCVRAMENRGERTVLVPDVRLRTIGPDATTNDLPQLWRLGRRFARDHDRDPYYNPNYISDRADFNPRANRPGLRDE